MRMRRAAPSSTPRLVLPAVTCSYQLLCWCFVIGRHRCCDADRGNNPAPCFSGRQLLVNPCLLKGSNFSRAKYCNASLPLEARVADALSHMTHAEKIGALGTVRPATPSLGLNCYDLGCHKRDNIRIYRIVYNHIVLDRRLSASRYNT